MSDRAVFFHRTCPPYVAGDIAGFSASKAQDLVDRGVASFNDPASPGAVAAEVDDQFSGMDRTQLIAYAAAHLGVSDPPRADVSDDQLRAALRPLPADLGAAASSDAPPAKGGKAKP